MLRRPIQYDVLLRVRRLQEDRHAQALAVARRDLAAAQQQHAALVDERLSVLGEAGQRTQRRFYGRDIQLFYQYERYLVRLIDEKNAQVDELRRLAEERRQELEQAMKRKRMVEKLKDRRMRALDAEMRKGEQKFVDETATNSAALRRAVARRGGEDQDL